MKAGRHPSRTVMESPPTPSTWCSLTHPGRTPRVSQQTPPFPCALHPSTALPPLLPTRLNLHLDFLGLPKSSAQPGGVHPAPPPPSGSASLPLFQPVMPMPSQLGTSTRAGDEEESTLGFSGSNSHAGKATGPWTKPTAPHQKGPQERKYRDSQRERNGAGAALCAPDSRSP